MTEALRHIYSMAHILMLQNRPGPLASAMCCPFSEGRISAALSGDDMPDGDAWRLIRPRGWVYVVAPGINGPSAQFFFRLRGTKKPRHLWRGKARSSLAM
ncbi:hypothetical protein OC65_23665 [Salmonella enterica]|nr:hypothetical protein [Salmonella enterica]